MERLGFDENFVDITEIVEKRLNQLQQSGCSRVCVSGHVYNHQGELNIQSMFVKFSTKYLSASKYCPELNSWKRVALCLVSIFESTCITNVNQHSS